MCACVLVSLWVWVEGEEVEVREGEVGWSDGGGGVWEELGVVVGRRGVTGYIFSSFLPLVLFLLGEIVAALFMLQA